MRITFSQGFDDGLRDITRVAEQLADAQRRVSSGKRLTVPSDDPAATVAAIDVHARLASVDVYEQTTDEASSRLAVADSALSDIINQLDSARVAAAASLVSSHTPQQLAALSQEVLGIRDALLADINTRFGNTYLFSGASATTTPYAIQANGTLSAYQGDSSPISVDVSRGREVPVTFDGSQIFQGGAAAHVLDVVTSLAASVASGDTAAIHQGLDDLQAALDRVNLAQTRVGNSQRILDDVRPQLSATRTAARDRLSRVEDANMAEAIADMTRGQTAQQAALGAFATLGRLSLMDYLK
jgi:flagellar hook-associated protein 3 FlgL